MNSIEQPLVARSHHELLASVPCLLGFHPADSVVVLALGPDGTVTAAARIEIADAEVPDRSGRLLAPFLRRAASANGSTVMLVGYGEDPQQVADVLLTTTRSLEWPVVQAFVISAGTWWFADEIDDPGRPYCPGSTVMAAEAALRGFHVAASRDELIAALVPDAGTQCVAADRLDDHHLALVRLNAEGLQQRLGEVLDRLLSDPAGASIESADVVDVAVLTSLAGARDAFWHRLVSRSPTRLFDIYRQVCRQLPPGRELSCLCAAGLAAWQAGFGAFATIALDQADRLAQGRRHRLHELLGDIHDMCVPPQMLRQWITTSSAEESPAAGE